MYILETLTPNLEDPQDLNWCLYVIKNDYLSISNSMLMNNQQRRFSKTQRIVKIDEPLEVEVLNNWVQTMLSSDNLESERRNNRFNSSQNLLLPQATPLPPIQMVEIQKPTDHNVKAFDNMINSNHFNAFELHQETKKNSLYFMLQYVNRKFHLEKDLQINPLKYQKFSQKLQAAYRDVSYHSSVHAADVIQSVYYFMVYGGG